MTRKQRPGPRKGTAVSQKGASRADAILDAATELLVTEGAGALVMRRVATQAGIAPGNLQYYFPTREQLLRAMLDRVMRRAREGLEAQLADPAIDLQALCDALMEGHLAPNSCRQFFELWALASHDEAAARPLRRFYEEFVAAVCAALLARRPRLSPAGALGRSRLFVAGLEGLSLFRSGTLAHAPNRTFDSDARRWLLNTLLA